MAAPSSILHVSVYLQPPGSLWLHCPVFYMCLFIYSHLDSLWLHRPVFYTVSVYLQPPGSLWLHHPVFRHVSVHLQPPGSLWLHHPVFYTCLFIYSHLDPYGCTVQYLDAAFRNIYNHGVMVITATDVAALYGELVADLEGVAFPRMANMFFNLMAFFSGTLTKNWLPFCYDRNFLYPQLR